MIRHTAAPTHQGIGESVTIRRVIGWDIGGVNTKVARVVRGEVLAVRRRPFELQRDPAALVPLLRDLAGEIGAGTDDTHAVTMTAELSQMFRTKREGVAFVLDAVEAAFPRSLIQVFAVDGRFLAPAQARQEPLAVAAANWGATAHAVARHHPDALLIDIGTTTTDIVPIAGGAVVAEGRTDPERLVSGELVYTGALRTPAEAIASQVPIGASLAGVSAEGFALAGDVQVGAGYLAPDDYTVPTPDGRPATREFAGERLARLVCADREMLDEAAISSIADALARAQVARITAAIERVLLHHPSLNLAVITGLGAFLGAAAAHAAGMKVVALAAQLGDAAARCAPAACVALLLEQSVIGMTPVVSVFREGEELTLTAETAESAEKNPGTLGRLPSPSLRPGKPAASVDIIVKLGGGVLADIAHFDAALGAIAAAGREHRLLVVPGGGPFADAVREMDRRLPLSDAAAHWMAILAMDQHAHLIASRLAGSVIVSDPREISAAFAAGRVPVLAPSRWLREADPLPHSWDVTSDSIAAWVAGQVGACRLVLIKPARLRLSDAAATGFGAVAPAADGDDRVDPYFPRALPADVAVTIVAADRIDVRQLTAE